MTVAVGWAVTVVDADRVATIAQPQIEVVLEFENVCDWAAQARLVGMHQVGRGMWAAWVVQDEAWRRESIVVTGGEVGTPAALQIKEKEN